ncbi:AprI/Inh family metalloprotease inhibitor [Roseibium sp. SCP14]|uniref:AprI/Inh family metalloprotease inhibitor n=1 Tax=Roseibium sp. SCP14 TaxID=3141375 RepID=UPI0033366B4C
MRLGLACVTLTLLLLAACNTTSTSPGVAPSPGDQDRPVEFGIVGEWNLKATDSVLSCRIKVSGNNDDKEGNATDFGCIGLDNFFMIRRWKRDRGTIEFFRLADDTPVASVYRVNRDEFRGELLPSGREIVLTRR